jgi:hypothetical protein
MPRVKTYTNTSDITPTDLNSIQDESILTKSTWTTIATFSNLGTVLSPGSSIYFFSLTDSDLASISGIVTLDDESIARFVTYIDNSLFEIPGTDVEYRISVQEMDFNSAVAVNRSFALYSLNQTESGISISTSAVPGSVLSLSNSMTVTVRYFNSSNPFNINSSGYYGLGFKNLSGGSYDAIELTASIEQRNVAI